MKLRYNSKFKQAYGACNMPPAKLPIFTDIGRHYLYVYNDNKQKSISVTMTKLFDIWHSASIAIQPIRGVELKLERYLNTLNTLRKTTGMKAFERNLTTHFAKFNILFDIAGCKCIIFENCQCKSIIKIPIAEQIFIVDQRTSRLMTIELSSRISTTYQSRVHEDRPESSCKFVISFINK